MSFDTEFQAQVSHMTLQDKNRLLQQSLQAKLKAKKADKVRKLCSKNQSKKYKKFVLLKKYTEEFEATAGQDGNVYMQLQGLKAKYRKLRMTQREKDNILDVQPEANEETLHSILGEIREEYLSDLHAEDIPNSEVSDIGEDELAGEQSKIGTMEEENDLTSKLEISKQLTEQYVESNHKFMSEFVNAYREDATEAKRNYYLQKLKFDLKENKGKIELRKMLYRYIEGMQWVLFYYYKGAPHWRWYYPYHYAPMISDLGRNIVSDFLDGQHQITEFRVDTNCSSNPKPYTPFQQLLCIFPVKSLRQFMPHDYLTLAEGTLSEYFPESFEIDLNGRTLPWEAAILIPFADEELFLEQEKRLFDRGMQLTAEDWKRNTTSFVYPAFFYDSSKAKNPKPLISTLKHFQKLPVDLSGTFDCHDYVNVGQFGFKSEQHPKVTYPLPGFPSLSWLKIRQLHYTEKYINKVRFERLLAIVPQAPEDLDGGRFEDWIYQFADQYSPVLYANLPQQVEAFPVSFEDPFSVYRLEPN